MRTVSFSVQGHLRPGATIDHVVAGDNKETRWIRFEDPDDFAAFSIHLGSADDALIERFIDVLGEELSFRRGTTSE